jgi:hypothetical protein
MRAHRNLVPGHPLITYGTEETRCGWPGRAGVVVVRVVTSAGRHVRRWVRAVRHTTVLAGVALGLVLVVVLTIAGAVGIDPLPGFAPTGRPPAPDGARSATQPEMRRSLLDSGDLPPGYIAVPRTAGLGNRPRAAADADSRTPAVNPSPTGPALLPDLGLTDLPLDKEIIGGTPAGRDETGHDRSDGPEALPGHSVDETGGAGEEVADGPDDGGGGGHDSSGEEIGHGESGRDEAGEDDDLGSEDVGDMVDGDPGSGDPVGGDPVGGDPVGGYTGGDTRGDTGEESERGGDVHGDARDGTDGGGVDGGGFDGDGDGFGAARPEARGAGAPTAHGADDASAAGPSDAAGGAGTTGTSRQARCRSLLTMPWRLAATGRGHVAPPQFADHLDRGRRVHLRQALVGFAGDDASAALVTLRRIAAGCDRFQHRAGDASRAGGSAARDHRDSGTGLSPLATVLLRPAARVTGAGPESADGLALRVAVVRSGRTWTGYLVVDRAGPVLSVLWLLAPDGVVTAGEASATRRAAALKSRPLAR